MKICARCGRRSAAGCRAGFPCRDAFAGPVGVADAVGRLLDAGCRSGWLAVLL